MFEFFNDLIVRCKGEYFFLFNVLIMFKLFLRSLKMFIILLCFEYLVVMFRVVLLFRLFLLR